jgi:thymidylate synthase
MINEACNVVKAATIGDAWREVMWLCIKNGIDFLVKGGSYVGQIRKQLSSVMIIIDEPGTRPLAPIMPPGIAGSTDEGKIEEYFAGYIMGDIKAPHEQYTYGEFIVAQIDQIIKLLIDSNGNTNQACIAIGDTATTFLSDPPCLRSITFKVVNGKLQATVFFRSWDLYAGLPENLGGIQLLKEHVLHEIQYAGLDVTDGPLIGMSDGLHIYDQYFEICDVLNVDKIQVGAQALADKAEFVDKHGA